MELGDDVDTAAVALGRLLEAVEEGELLLHVTGADALLAAPPPALLRRLARLRGVLLLSVESERAPSEAARAMITVHVPFALPDASAREAIWRLHLPRGITGIDTTALARHALTGGAIRSAVERALLLAAAEGSAPATLHFERAARLA